MRLTEREKEIIELAKMKGNVRWEEIYPFIIRHAGYAYKSLQLLVHLGFLSPSGEKKRISDRIIVSQVYLFYEIVPFLQKERDQLSWNEQRILKIEEVK